MGNLWRRLTLSRYSLHTVVAAFLLGAILAVPAALWSTGGRKSADPAISRGHPGLTHSKRAPGTPPHLERALMSLRSLGRSSGKAGATRAPALESDTSLAEGLRPRLESYFAASSLRGALSHQLALQLVTAGTEREESSYSSSHFQALTQKPQVTSETIAKTLPRLPAHAAQERIELLKLAANLPRTSENTPLLKELFRTEALRITAAAESGSPAPLIALFAYLELETDIELQRATVQTALRTQNDEAMRLAIRKLLFIRSARSAETLTHEGSAL